MWQLFKQLDYKQYTERDLERVLIMRESMLREQRKINGMIEASAMMIQHLETELENMK